MNTHQTPTIRLTVGQAVVKYLAAQYTERDGVSRRAIPGIFGIFGHGNVAGVGQGLAEFRDEMTYHQVRNEQSMVHAATAYAKESKGLSTYACTASIGPGSTNMATGAATATINRLPVLLLPSDIYVTRRQGPVLQQLEHPLAGDLSVNDLFRPISRYFDRISRAEQLLTALPETMRVLTTPGETGAVTLSLPQDLQSLAYEYPASFFEERHWRVDRTPPTPEAIADAVSLLREAERPLIVAGGGLRYSEAEQTLHDFAHAHGIPVVETFAGRGSSLVEDELALGGLGATGNVAAGRIARDADLVICIGTRLNDFITGSHSVFRNPSVRFININTSRYDAYKNGGLPLVGDARAVLERLNQEGIRFTSSEGYRREVAETRAEWREERERVFSPTDAEVPPQAEVIGAMLRQARSGDLVVAAAGSAPGDLQRGWDATEGRDCHIEWGTSCMGYEIPAAIGARFARPEGRITVAIGDGTFLMMPSEIVTAVQEGIDMTIVLSENHGFQCIRDLQLATTGFDFGNEFRHRGDSWLSEDYISLDLGKVVEGLGATLTRVRGAAEFEQALVDTRDARGVTVILIETDRERTLPDSDVWNEVIPSEVTHSATGAELFPAYEQVRDERQKFYY
ncbi:3D-(3,5/4)-trihydroxycyclohexane-1,2-dione acylhydrolase (decyclizing) [Gulosibacter chungangensis]|uniref:3D-(3,5/4)-trihydroxycyclohexane-1,2-dione acylhydrolase (Decyclizing) n=1 Tax=Gulosibacter chungangensis TaxID=979746 RepID=A0A7J5B9U1_9MICO|nr:3D-(3,5/4)-trihydroxycyclohexane-1,2-dione acylhydrolase (decyclizing) [Gulosibacter chungangensis]KAB1642313.1 3D-(3,5/4)-trihydroxycyclohexane-1,2-dione acylhydrolase (decyclizing) [Gulosibacter chungangensis]